MCARAPTPAPRPRVARVHDTRHTFPARPTAMSSLGDGARREYTAGQGAIGLLESRLGSFAAAPTGPRRPEATRVLTLTRAPSPVHFDTGPVAAPAARGKRKGVEKGAVPRSPGGKTRSQNKIATRPAPGVRAPGDTPPAGRVMSTAAAADVAGVRSTSQQQQLDGVDGGDSEMAPPPTGAAARAAAAAAAAAAAVRGRDAFFAAAGAASVGGQSDGVIPAVAPVPAGAIDLLLSAAAAVASIPLPAGAPPRAESGAGAMGQDDTAPAAPPLPLAAVGVEPAAAAVAAVSADARVDVVVDPSNMNRVCGFPGCRHVSRVRITGLDVLVFGCVCKTAQAATGDDTRDPVHAYTRGPRSLDGAQRFSHTAAPCTP